MYSGLHWTGGQSIQLLALVIGVQAGNAKKGTEAYYTAYGGS